MEHWNTRTMDVQPRQPEVLKSSGEGRAILIALPSGEMLQDHQVHERAWLLVVEGEIEIRDGGSATGGQAGLLAEFDPNERHEIRAVSDSRLLLLLAPWPGEGHPSRRADAAEPL